MRKFYSTLKSVVAGALVAAMALASSCSYDDTAIKNDVEQIKKDLTALTERVAALETRLQGEIDAVKALIDGQVVIVDVVTDTEGNQTIKLSNGEDITVLAPVECTCEPAEPCQCDPLEYRVVDGVLEVSADGENWVAINGVTAECVVASVVVEDGVATITLADGTVFEVAVAELVEFEAAKSAIYVKAAETKSIAFAINDAVEDINVMNQPLGWKASVEAPTRAVGGMDYVLNITAPAKDFLQYADKTGKVSIHFNTAAGACKVMSVDVELASIDLQVDKAGNITINSTVVDEYDKTDWWGETEHVVEFNNFYIAVFDLDTYYEINGDLESVYNSSWGEFNIPAAAGYINNVVTNIGDNSYEEMTYVDGVNEKWTINATVENVLKNLDWYDQLPYEGNSFMVCVIPTDISKNGAPVWAETIAVPFKQLSISIVENVDNRAFNNAYFNVTLRGGSAYYLYPASKADIDMYVNEYQYYASAEEYFWASLESYLQNPDWASFGFKIESDVVEENIALSNLLAYTRDYYYFETKPATEYIMCLFVEEEGKTEYTIEDLRLYEFATADLTLAESEFEVTYEMADDWSLYTIGVNVTVPETTNTVYSRWYNEEKDEEALLADLIANGYAREPGDFEESGYTYYLGTSVDEPAAERFLGLLVIDAEGNYTLKNLPFKSKDLVMNDVDFTIAKVDFTSSAVTVTLDGLDGLEVKNYKYYFISTDGGSYYQKTEEECQDIAYSSNWLYKSTTAYPIIITSTADYKYSFSDGTYKLAVGLEFADGSFSKCVYGEYEYVQLPVELTSVTAAYQENDPNWYAFTFTTAAGDVITTTLGNGGVNYLNEGTYDFNNYFDSGFAIGNTYMNGTQWVSSIKITVKYDGGNYDLTINSSVGKFHYNGAIEGLIVPGAEEPTESVDVVATSASARFNSDNSYATIVDFQLTADVVASVAFRTGEGNWDATNYFTRGLDYINAGVWNTYSNKGDSNVWFTNAYLNNEYAEIVGSIKVTYHDTYSFAFTINNYNVTYTGDVVGLVAPQVTGDGAVAEEEEDLPEFVIPGDGVTYDMDYRYTTLVDGLDDSNALRVAQSNGWTWDIKFNSGLASIEPGDYKAVRSFSADDALEVDTYNGGFQNHAFNYIYPDEYEKVTTFNVQKEGDIYCITMIGSGGYGNDVGTFRCVYIGKI